MSIYSFDFTFHLIFISPGAIYTYSLINGKLGLDIVKSNGN